MHSSVAYLIRCGKMKVNKVVYILRRAVNQRSVAALSSPHSVLFTYNRRVRLIFVLKFDTPTNISYWRPSLQNTLSGYNSTETVSWLSRNLRKALTLFR